MKEFFKIEPHTGGKGFLLHLKTGDIDVPDNYGGYIVSSGCGSGKTESIKNLIRQKCNDGILYCVDTKDELNKMYHWIKDNLVGKELKESDVMIISTDKEHSISLGQYKDNPEIIIKKKVILITHVRFWTDLINYFLIYNSSGGAVNPFDGDFERLMIRNDLRKYVIFDETPTFIKPFVCFPSSMMAAFSKEVDNKYVCKSSEEIVRTYNSFIDGTKDDIFTKGTKINRIKKQVALNLVIQYYDRWSVSEDKEMAITFYPIDLAQTKMKTHILIFEGVGDILFRGSTNFQLLDTDQKYNTLTEFNKIKFKGLDRKNLPKTKFNNLIRKVAKLITKPSLIVCWKDINNEPSEPGKSPFKMKVKEALGRKVSPSIKYEVTYYGSSDNKSTNDYRDFKQIILIGNWNLPNTEAEKIRRAYGTNTDTKNQKDWYFTQLISRIGIRKHQSEEKYTVFYTSDYDERFIERMEAYLNDNRIIRKHSSRNKDWEEAIKGIRKKTRNEIEKLAKNDKKMQKAIVNGKGYSKTVTFKDLDGLGIKRSAHEKRKYEVLIKKLRKLKIELKIETVKKFGC